MTMATDYPTLRAELQKLAAKLAQELPGPMAGFGALHKAATADGALSRKVKELITLGISIAARCDGCIAYHTQGALKAGATRPEILDVIGVAIFMGGGPSMIYGCEALAALDQFEAKPA
jgi:AhpD family alkylhydroperoxidase